MVLADGIRSSATPIGASSMSELPYLLREIVSRQCRENKIALLLSAGRDSVTTGIACQHAGKTIHAYTYELHGYRSYERERVEAIARHFGWELTVVTVPTRDPAADFKRLAIGLRCKKKVQFEVSYPLLYVIPAIEESEIWTGWNADDHYGNTREYLFCQARLKRKGATTAQRKEHFDAHRLGTYAEFDRPGSSHTFWKAVGLASQHGKRLLDAYADPAMRELFFCFDHDQLSPLSKPIIREAYSDAFSGLPEKWIAKGERLQKGGRVDELFRTLLSNPDINRFETKYEAVSPLCQRWGAEIEANPTAFAAELDGLPLQPQAIVRRSQDGGYKSYRMADVRTASAAKAFTVISTFAGGGGSSIGYRLAGGRILMANEFVPQAARTYGTNFPDVVVDQRDIREISANDDIVAAFLAGTGLAPGELDVLDGSPPCCEFSTAGNGIGDQDVLRPYSDVRQSNIASLVFDLIDLVTRAQPKVFICENVPAFATRGAEVFQRALRALRFPADGPGRAYYANFAVLSASDFGVPQKRQRLFIIGVRKDVGDTICIDRDEAVRDVFPAPTHVGVSIRSALANLRQTENDVWPWTRSAMVSPLGGLIRLLPKSPPKPTRLGHVFPGYKKHYTLTRCCWDKPAPTMVVSGQRPDGLTGAIHPDKDRKFTLPELKRLTALPDDFVLTGTLGQAAERVCRMVPPLLTKAIAESVYEKVLKPYQEKTHESR
jgi:DNA (cytosine-5)-methyltransferase 1